MPKRETPEIPEELRDDKLPRGIFSASQYGLYKKCPKAYEFRYLDNVSSPPAALMFKGTLVHTAAEFSHKRIIETKAAPTLAEAQAVVADTFEAEHKEVVDWEGETPGAIKDASIRLYSVYHQQAIPKVNPISAEQHFAVRVGSVPIQGYIDLIDNPRGPARDGIEDPGEVVVADMKTSKASWSQGDIDKDPQFTLYSIVTGVPKVRVDNLVQLKTGPKLNQLTAARDRQTTEVFIEDLEETADLVKRGVFPRTSIDSWACTERWCGYWSMCRGRRR